MSEIVKAKTIQGLMALPEMKEKFQNMLGERVQGFFVSVSNCVANSSLLAKSEPNSVLMAAGVAASLDLPIDPNLGFAYIVPYNQSYKDERGQWQKKAVAQFQIGWRGFVQLAQRSGQFKIINVTEVKQGEIDHEDMLSGEIIFKWLPRSEREKKPVIGYVSYFRLLNGFEKSFYMSKPEAETHARKYSQTYKDNKGKWVDDFDSMAKKTVLKLLLSKFAPLSIQMQRANRADQGVIKDVDNDVIDVEYSDNQPESLNIGAVEDEKEKESVADHIRTSTTIDVLEELDPELIIKTGLTDLYNERKDAITAGK